MTSRMSWKIIVSIVALIILGIVIFLWTQVARASIGNLQVYQGSAELTRSGRTQAGSTGEPIRLGDTLKIASGSRVAIVLKDSSVIRLEAGTEAQVAELEYQGQKISQAIFKLKFGRLWSRVAPLDQNGTFEVETPTAVAAVAGTNYNTTYNEQRTGVYVYRKRVSVALLTNRPNRKIVSQEELLQMDNHRLQEDFARGSRLVPDEYIDDWIVFNQSEDDKICREKPPTPGCEGYFEEPIKPVINISPNPLPDISNNQPSASPSESGKKPTVAGVQQSRPAKESTKPADTQANTQIQNVPSTESVSIPTPVPTPEPNPPSVNQTPPTVAPIMLTEPSPPPPSNDQPTPIPSPPSITLSSLVLSADRTSINTDERTSVKVTAHYSDQSTQDVTSQSKFAIIQGSGTIINNVFSASQAGVVKVKATFDSHASNEISIEVKQSKKLIDLRLSFKIVDQNKRTAQFSAIAIYSDDSQEDVTRDEKRIRWGLKERSLAMISKTGLYSANQSQGDTVVAEFEGLSRELFISISFRSPQ